jgi:hypothetical protein
VIPIVIMTWKRVRNQQTFALLAPALRQKVTFVVRPEEADEMRLR